MACGNATFMNHTGASACYICPEGYYCVNRDHADICPQGYYCPTGTGADWQLCPVGTFGNTTGLSEEAHCTFCTGVFLCVCVREREGEEKRKNPQVRENKSQTSLRILNCVVCVCVFIFQGVTTAIPQAYLLPALNVLLVIIVSMVLTRQHQQTPHSTLG